MPSAPPSGEPAPLDGRLPDRALDAFAAGGPFGYYVHVPFCARRCGYCDFNTYVPAAGEPGAKAVRTYIDAVAREIDLSAEVLGADGRALRPVDTVFFGGGTPTMLAADELVAILHRIRDRFGLTDGAEITTEANPDSVTPESIEALAEGGFTRISLGMQSVVPHVLATLDRTHSAENVERAVAAARDVGLATSLDLIYGTPGESLSDWAATLRAAIDLQPEHISAYALVVEEGTAMGAALARGTLEAPDDDDEADKYELADAMLSRAGFGWYEVSNWTRTDRGRCRHNEGYWRDGHWWGAGPGSHGHVGGVRWWDLRFPATYAMRLAEGSSPAEARELPDDEQAFTEKLMLGIRLRGGIPLTMLDSPHAAGRGVLDELIDDGLLEPSPAVGRQGEGEPRAVLTMRGRLLADSVIRTMLGF